MNGASHVELHANEKGFSINYDMVVMKSMVNFNERSFVLTAFRFELDANFCCRT